MRLFAKLYVDFMEKAFIGMVLVSLVLTAISGFAYGTRGRIPAILSTITLGLIVYVCIGRRRILKESPSFRVKYFGEIGVFFFLLQRKVSRIAGVSRLDSGKHVLLQAVSKSIVLMVVALAVVALWSSFSISAHIAASRQIEEKQIEDVKHNQAKAGARPGIPATFFNRAVVIEVLQVSNDGKVTAIVKSQDNPDVKIESEEVGYTTNYKGQFLIRIDGVENSTVQFFVERLQGSSVPR